MVKKQQPPPQKTTSTARTSKKAASPKKVETQSSWLRRITLDPMVIRVAVGLVIIGVVFFITQPSMVDKAAETIGLEAQPNTHGGILNGSATLSNVFTPEVLYWRDNLERWAAERGVNPNVLATIMQIESCGDPYVSSHAGAQGLFQVMPFHFDPGENQINPERNAHNGIDHLLECLQLSNYDMGVSFACYNGGASVIYMPQSQWYDETRSYYRWGTGIYSEAVSGADQSQTLQQWLDAGGSGLCSQASSTQALMQP